MVRPKMSLICVEKITTAMPEVNPVVTGNGMKRISAPMRQKPRIMRKRPAISVQTSSPDAWYCSSTPMMMMTKAPVGPPIWYLLPLNREMRKPATMAVMRPWVGESPHAIAKAIASGMATTPTVSPAKRSARKVCLV